MSWSRIISGLVAIAVALGMIIFGGWWFTAGMGVIVYLGQLEYFQLARAKGIAPAAKTTLVLSQVMLVVAALNSNLVDAIFTLAGTIICFYLLFQPKLATIADISSSILGLFYGGYLPSYWIRLRVGLEAQLQIFQIDLENYEGILWIDPLSWPSSLTFTLLSFCCIWAADIGAYFVGKFFGRIRLSEISPKKTVEGAVFGVLGSLGVATIGSWYLDWPGSPLTGAVLA